MDHVGILSADTIALVSSFISERVSVKVFSRFGFMTYMFFLVFFIWYLQGVKAKRVA